MKGKKFNSNDKAKDFKSAILRLFKELKSFKIVIFIALILAAFGSIISIFTPNILSDLTDKVSDGIVLDKDNLDKISSKMKESFSEENLNTIIPIIFEMDLSKENISKILNSNIKSNEKETFNIFLSDLNNAKSNVFKLSDNVLKMLFVQSKYKNNIITVDDKVMFVNCYREKKNDYPESILRIILSDFEINGIKITVSDQISTLKLLSNAGNEKNINPGDLYKSINKMPQNIQSLINPKMDISGIKKIALLLLILYIISALFTYVEGISMANVSNKFAKNLRMSISKKINKLPLKYFDDNSKGDILSRVTNDVDMIAQSMNNSLSTLVSAVTLFVGTIIMMFSTNVIMAITAILSSLFGFVFMASVLSKSQKYFDARQKHLGEINGHIEEVYSGLNVVKCYNAKEEVDNKFDELNKNMYDANRKSQFLSGLMMPMMSFIGNFGYVAVCIVGALLAMNGNISFGVIVAFILYVRLFISPLSQIAQSMTSLQSTAAASERVFEFIDEEEMSSEEKIIDKLDKDTVKGNIEFKNVTFTYSGNDTPTIKNFSAKAKSGEKIAIVGPTGAGKTTIVNLLMKFYDIDSGEILIDGISTKKISRKNIHELFTMVLQDSWLFEGSLKENIKYNRENVSLERIKEVCKIVGLDHFIKTLPKGYDSVLSENDNISSGQKQLLTIARAMIEDSPFLILDEATSNVDTRTEELVQKAMDRLTKGRTSFIIAHRLSTIKNADLILVMKDGNIIEQGNHAELMKKNGFYSELYNSQFEL